MADQEPTWLTQEAFDRLTAELEYLQTEKRPEIVKRIEIARDEGDLKENGGYHAAREEQGKNEGRIAQLKALLANAHVGEATDTSKVGPGMVVTVTLAGDDMKFLLGSREVAATTDLDVYSEKSPLGSAILGAVEGETRHYTAPNGNDMEVVVKSFVPYEA
ncbi:MAG: transcription elongation factor GreA [Bifidobacteriaceae bacterium]|jgi:transcription elongation factor GreA|nr:transcription elongation factor GreA [Bifidobacteriaceae bacterium]